MELNPLVLFFGAFDFCEPCDNKIDEFCVHSLSFASRGAIIRNLRQYRLFNGEIYIIIRGFFEEDNLIFEYGDFSGCILYKDYEFAYNLEIVSQFFDAEWNISNLSEGFDKFYLIEIYHKIPQPQPLEELAFLSAYRNYSIYDLFRILPRGYVEEMVHRVGQFYSVI